MNHLSFHAMGSTVNVWAEADVREIPAQVEAYEAILSRFRSDSDLMRLNAQLGEGVAVDDVLAENLRAALSAAHLTGGLVTPLVLKALVMAGYADDFSVPLPAWDGAIHLHDWRDIHVDANQVWLPDEIDFGGTAKGWTAARIAQDLGTALVDMGGDIVATGRVWTVLVADPFQPDQPFATVTLKDRAIATSGTDYRGQHIIDPRTGRAAQTDVLSATVIHPDAVSAEALAKAVLIMGSAAGLHWLSTHPDAAGLVFCHDGSVIATENFQTTIKE